MASRISMEIYILYLVKPLLESMKSVSSSTAGQEFTWVYAAITFTLLTPASFQLPSKSSNQNCLERVYLYKMCFKETFGTSFPIKKSPQILGFQKSKQKNNNESYQL